MARIVVAGAGAAGASVAYHLALLGAEDVVLADPRGVAGGSTSRAMGGVRQQFSTAAEVRLAQASIRFFAELGPPLFRQVGYLFLATTEPGLAALEERRELQAGARRPGRARRPRRGAGAGASTTCSARSRAARTASPIRPACAARSSAARSSSESTCGRASTRSSSTGTSS